MELRPRFVRVSGFQSTFPCVSLPGMNKTGAKRAGSTHPGRYTPWHEPLSRPIIRTYSAEVTSLIASNLPHHRSAPFGRRLTIVQQGYIKSQGLFSGFPKFFHGFGAFCGNRPVQLHKKAPPPRGGGICRGGYHPPGSLCRVRQPRRALPSAPHLRRRAESSRPTKF